MDSDIRLRGRLAGVAGRSPGDVSAGVTARAGVGGTSSTSVSNSHASFSWPTFFGVICLSGEYRVLPGSCPADGQSFCALTTNGAITMSAQRNRFNIMGRSNEPWAIRVLARGNTEFACLL